MFFVRSEKIERMQPRQLMRGHVTAVKADSSNLDDLDNLIRTNQTPEKKARIEIVYANCRRPARLAPSGENF